MFDGGEMSYTNVTLNGLRMPIKEKSTLRDVIENYFDLRCEFLVSRNSKQIPSDKYNACRIKENDILQVVSYSKCCYKIHKRTVFKQGTQKHKKV